MASFRISKEANTENKCKENETLVPVLNMLHVFPMQLKIEEIKSLEINEHNGITFNMKNDSTLHSANLFSDLEIEDNLKNDSANNCANTCSESLICKVCEKIFQNKDLLEDHMNLHELSVNEKSIETSYGIDHSGSDHSNADTSALHKNSRISILKNFDVDNSVKIETIKCLLCGLRYKKLQHLKRHLRVDHLQVNNEECGMNVDKSDEQEPKIDKSAEKNVFICESCGKQYDTFNQLNRHLKTHGGEENNEERKSEFYCTSCNRHFRRQSNLEKHVKSNCKGLLTFKCEICGRCFRNKNDYMCHQRTHTGEKRFTCDVCGKQFKYSHGFKYHLNHVHKGIKNHECDICGRKFALKQFVDEHRRIHTGERPKVCHVCGKSFRTQTALFVHSKIHSDIFAHPCSFCDKRFRHRHQLKNHIMCHTGEKPHVCNICGKTFRARETLKSHVETHIIVSSDFECEICGKLFKQKRYLRQHSRKCKTRSC